MTKRRRSSRQRSPVNGPPPQRPEHQPFSTEGKSFDERLRGLTGKTTYRVPSPRGTKASPVPEEHMDAAALAMAAARSGRVGPAIAMAVIMQNDHGRDEVVEAVARALAALSRTADNRPFQYAAMAAWDEMVHGRKTAAPKAIASSAWDALLRLATSVMESERSLAVTSAKLARNGN